MRELSWGIIMKKIGANVKNIYLYSHQIDMRLGMEKIQVILSQNFSPLELLDSMFVFVSRSRKIVKIYHEDEFGRTLLTRKLNYSKFRWPDFDEGGTLSTKDLKYLLEGAEVTKYRAKISYA